MPPTRIRFCQQRRQGKRSGPLFSSTCGRFIRSSQIRCPFAVFAKGHLIVSNDISLLVSITIHVKRDHASSELFSSASPPSASSEDDTSPSLVDSSALDHSSLGFGPYSLSPRSLSVTKNTKSPIAPTNGTRAIRSHHPLRPVSLQSSEVYREHRDNHTEIIE